MLTNGPNIYQAARKESCLTQEQAAERLEVSETTVKAWEQGMRVPDNETVARMAELYETPWLALEHLKQADGIIDEKERPDFDAICRDLDGIVGAALQVKYTSDAPPKAKKERPEAATSERSWGKACGLEQSTLEQVNYSTRSTPHASPNFCREGGAFL